MHFRANRIFLLTIVIILGMLLSLVTEGCYSYQLPENLYIGVGHSDLDHDGLPDQAEIVVGTDPKKPDTDGDGMKDGAEIRMRLDPRNPDTDGDNLPDADEFLPRINNNTFYQYIGISVLVITIVVLSLLHIKFGLSKKRKEKVRETREKRRQEETLFKQVQGRILELAMQKHGWLNVSDVADSLALDPKLVVKYFTKLKARKEGSLYCFPDIEKSFNK